MVRTTLLFAGLALVALPATALAQTSATTTSDLNLRAGPGGNYEVLTTMPRGSTVDLLGCVEGGNWCQVDYRGTAGYAFADYLTAPVDGRQVVVRERPGLVGTVVGEPIEGAREVAGAVAGTIAGIAGGVADAIDPDPSVTTYVRDNPVDPVTLRGEVAVGAGLPGTVGLNPVPNYDYRYAYVNGQPVLVDPATRRIVYVYR